MQEVKETKSEKNADTLILLMGKEGSGKSTFSYSLIQKYPDQVDEIACAESLKRLCSFNIPFDILLGDTTYSRKKREESNWYMSLAWLFPLISCISIPLVVILMYYINGLYIILVTILFFNMTNFSIHPIIKYMIKYTNVLSFELPNSNIFHKSLIYLKLSWSLTKLWCQWKFLLRGNKLSGRELLQWVGTALRGVNPRIFALHTTAKVEKAFAFHNIIIVPDCRYIEEIELLSSMAKKTNINCFIVHVDRRNRVAGTHENHISSYGYQSFLDKATHTLVNDCATAEEFQEKSLKFYQDILAT